MNINSQNSCPCCSEMPYSLCCEHFIEGLQLPDTPEQLMRSRFTAFVLKNVDYILSTVTGPAKTTQTKESLQSSLNEVEWQKLEVVRSAILETGLGEVEFKAYYSLNNETHILHEISTFQRIENKWHYKDGQLIE